MMQPKIWPEHDFVPRMTTWVKKALIDQILLIEQSIKSGSGQWGR